eukprot:evm.model.scf_955.3 EVM.evm.TU.scf_955.3   scf_955:17341-21250(-)
MYGTQFGRHVRHPLPSAPDGFVSRGRIYSPTWGRPSAEGLEAHQAQGATGGAGRPPALLPRGEPRGRLGRLEERALISTKVDPAVMSSQNPVPKRGGKGSPAKEGQPGPFTRSRSQTQPRQAKDDSVLERTKSMPPQRRRAPQHSDAEGLKAWSPETRRSALHRVSVPKGNSQGLSTGQSQGNTKESQHAQLRALQSKRNGQRRSKSLANVAAEVDTAIDDSMDSLKLDLGMVSADVSDVQTAKSGADSGCLTPHPVDAFSDEASDDATEDDQQQSPGSMLADTLVPPSGMAGAFNKTMQALASAAHNVYPWQPFAGGQLSWLLRTEGSDVPGGQLARSPLADDVDSLEGLLLWRCAWKSGKAFAMGLYLLICLKVYLDSGIHIVQPTTAVAGLALCVLVYNSLLRSAVAHASQSSSDDDLHEETILLHRVSSGISTVGNAAAVTLPPFFALPCRHLSNPRGPPTFYLGLCLWVVMLVGELKLLFQTTLLLIVWIGLFTLPKLYVENRWLLDKLARAGGAVLIAALRKRHRAALLLAVFAGCTVFWALDVAFVVRSTLAMAAGGGTLLWRVSRGSAQVSKCRAK